jgi:hypothetical protein
MWQTHREGLCPRLFVRIAGYVPILAAAAAGGAGAPSTAEKDFALVSLSVAPEEGSEKSSSPSVSRGPTLATFWRTLSPTLVAVGLFCLLGLTISAAVILHLPEELFSWVLTHVE